MVELFKYSQLILVLATALVTAYIVFKITSSFFLSYGAIIIIGFSNSLLDTAIILYAENLVALLVIAVEA